MNLGEGVRGRRCKDGRDGAWASLLAKECQSPLEGELRGCLGPGFLRLPGNTQDFGGCCLGAGVARAKDGPLGKAMPLVESRCQEGRHSGTIPLLSPDTTDWGRRHSQGRGKQQVGSKQADQQSKAANSFC